MKKQLILIFILFQIQISLQTNGIDTNQYLSETTCQCLQSSGNSFVVLEAYEGQGFTNQNTPQSIENCQKSANELDIQIYHVPCAKGVSVESQVQQVKLLLEGKNFSKYWINVGYNPNVECGWDYNDPDFNCEFLYRMVTEVSQQFSDSNVEVGIYSQRIDWYNIFGDYNSCPLFTDLPLWYKNINSLQDFDSYKQFGGWDTPSVKQYQYNRTQCNKNVNLDWQP